jgi:hypothetical protein
MPATRNRSVASPCRSLTVVLLLAALSLACFPREPEEGTRQQAELVQAMVDAPCDTQDFYQMARREDVSTTVFVSANDLLDSEVHDCQRLITGGTLGPLAGILVSTSRVEMPDFAAGVVVAEILNYDGPLYAELGIHPGLNCLWLQGDAVNNPDGAGWIAAIVQPNRNGNCVMDAPFQPATTQQLQLYRRQHGGTVYPSTGRWMWDGSRQFIGIRCGDGWCELGHGFTPTPAIATVEDVPGWFDEQLMSYAPTRGASLQLSGLLGRITPAPGLISLPDDAFDGPNGAPVASIAFIGNDAEALAAYRRKFDLPGNATSAQLRHRRTGSPLGPVTREYATTGNNWRAVYHNEHAKHAGRGAVRWAWNEADEAAWYPCDLGCCTTDALQ